MVRTRSFGEEWTLCWNETLELYCPKGHAALSRSTSVKPPALPEVADVESRHRRNQAGGDAFGRWWSFVVGTGSSLLLGFKA